VRILQLHYYDKPADCRQCTGLWMCYSPSNEADRLGDHAALALTGGRIGSQLKPGNYVHFYLYMYSLPRRSLLHGCAPRTICFLTLARACAVAPFSACFVFGLRAHPIIATNLYHGSRVLRYNWLYPFWDFPLYRAKARSPRHPFHCGALSATHHSPNQLAY
jgi:hypothetical protein